MTVKRVRIANTEAIAQYKIEKDGVHLLRIMTTNYNGKGRRYISLDAENQNKLIAIIAEEMANVN